MLTYFQIVHRLILSLVLVARLGSIASACLSAGCVPQFWKPTKVQTKQILFFSPGKGTGKPYEPRLHRSSRHWFGVRFKDNQPESPGGVSTPCKRDSTDPPPPPNDSKSATCGSRKNDSKSALKGGPCPLSLGFPRLGFSLSLCKKRPRNLETLAQAWESSPIVSHWPRKVRDFQLSELHEAAALFRGQKNFLRPTSGLRGFGAGEGSRVGPGRCSFRAQGNGQLKESAP